MLCLSPSVNRHLRIPTVFKGFDVQGVSRGGNKVHVLKVFSLWLQSRKGLRTIRRKHIVSTIGKQTSAKYIPDCLARPRWEVGLEVYVPRRREH